MEIPKNARNFAATLIGVVTATGLNPDTLSARSPDRQGKPVPITTQENYEKGKLEMYKGMRELYGLDKESLLKKEKEGVIKKLDDHVSKDTNFDYFSLRRAIDVPLDFEWNSVVGKRYLGYIVDYCVQKIRQMGNVDPNSNEIFKLNKLRRIKNEAEVYLK